MGLDPLSAISGGLQGLGGIIQTIGGATQAKRAQRGLENMVNSYKPNQSIMDYYSKALNRYNPNAYNSKFYQQQQNEVGRNLATGINAAQDRRGGLAALGSLVQGSNDALRNAGVAAENIEGSNLNRLGSATQMKAAEDFKPFEMKYNLKAMKAAGGAQIMNAGLHNIFGGASSLANASFMDKIYGDKKQPEGKIRPTYF